MHRFTVDSSAHGTIRQEVRGQEYGQNYTLFGLKSTIFHRCFHKQREGSREHDLLEIATYCLRVQRGRLPAVELCGRPRWSRNRRDEDRGLKPVCGAAAGVDDLRWFEAGREPDMLFPFDTARSEERE